MITFLQLELTGNCQLACSHCYAESSPVASHGAMAIQDWERVMVEAAGMGVGMVQLIGGEPTRHPAFARILDCAVDTIGRVEVYTNLVHIPDPVWDRFACPGVSVATSYYSDRADQHDAVTGRRGSHAKTRANITKAIKRGIPVRAGVVDVLDQQRMEEAQADLENLGVTRIGPADRVRGVGRGTAATPNVDQLCGHCGDTRAAISPDGDVTPCTMARWGQMVAGNVQEQPLAAIVESDRWRGIVSTIPSRGATACKPDSDGNDCAPAETIACLPKLEEG